MSGASTRALPPPACAGVLLDRPAVAARLPHRPPFLFIDRVQQLDAAGARGVAVWPADHPILAGHFPGLPIVPGVCLLEAAAQLAGVLIGQATGDSAAPLIGVLSDVRQAGFRHPVLADEEVEIDLRARCVLPRLWAVHAQGWLRRGAETPLEAFHCDFSLAARERPGAAQPSPATAERAA